MNGTLRQETAITEAVTNFFFRVWKTVTLCRPPEPFSGFCCQMVERDSNLYKVSNEPVIVQGKTQEASSI